MMKRFKHSVYWLINKKSKDICTCKFQSHSNNREIVIKKSYILLGYKYNPFNMFCIKIVSNLQEMLKTFNDNIVQVYVLW